MRKNKELYVARGIVRFADSLMLQHHVDRAQCLAHLIALLNREANVLSGIDPDRNK